MTFRTLSELFHYNVEHRADSICSEMFGGEQVSYREFGRRAEKIQTSFRVLSFRLFWMAIPSSPTNSIATIYSLL